MDWSWLTGGGGARGVVEDEAQLRAGRASVRGSLLVDKPLLSPLNSRECAAYYYRATYQASSRLKGYIRRRLRDATVYGDGLSLKVGETHIALRPAASEPFTRDDHLKLKGADIDGFDAREQTMRVGADVVASGTLKRHGDGWLMKVVAIEITPEEQALVDKAKEKRAKSPARKGPPKPGRSKKRR